VVANDDLSYSSSFPSLLDNVSMGAAWLLNDTASPLFDEIVLQQNGVLVVYSSQNNVSFLMKWARERGIVKVGEGRRRSGGAAKPHSFISNIRQFRN
jgi:hypothetical protein